MKQLRYIILACVAIALLGGCQDKPKTQKQEMTEQWNKARAGVQFGLAKQHFEGGNLDKARQSINEALVLDPTHVPGLILSARIAIEQNDLETARNALESALVTMPESAEADYLCGLVYERWHQLDQALAHYQAAWAKAPTELSYVMAVAETMVTLGQDDEALALLQDKVTYFEHSGMIRDAVAQLLQRKGEYAKAAAMFRQAAVLEGNDPQIQARYGIALYQSGNYRDAVDVLERLVGDENMAKRGDLQLALGESLLKIDRARDARAALETATQQMPASAHAWMALARAAIDTGDLRRAKIALNKSMSLGGDKSEMALMTGYIALQEQNFDEALKQFEKASAQDDRDTLSLCMIGLTLEHMNRGVEAASYYGQALKIKPSDPLANQLMGSLSYAE